MPRLTAAPSESGRHLKPSAFIGQHAEMIGHRVRGPIADVACGSGRNLVPFLRSGQTIDCYDIRENSLDPYIVNVAGPRITQHQVDLLSEKFDLSRSRYGLVLLVHFYSADVLAKIVRSLKPGGFLIVETIDDRGGNYLQLPRAGEVLLAIAPTIKVLSCQAKLAGPDSVRQVIKLIGERSSRKQGTY